MNEGSAMLMKTGLGNGRLVDEGNSLNARSQEFISFARRVSNVRTCARLVALTGVPELRWYQKSAA